NRTCDIESDIREIEFLPYQGEDSDFKDSIDESVLTHCDDLFVDPTPEMDDLLFSPDNEDKVFNPGILSHKKSVKIITQVTHEKKLAVSFASWLFEDFDPPFYELLVFKEVPNSMRLLPFSSKNEEKVFNPGIYTFKKFHCCFLLELSHPVFHLSSIPELMKILANGFHYLKSLLSPLFNLGITNYNPKGERFLIALRFPTPPLACAFFILRATETSSSKLARDQTSNPTSSTNPTPKGQIHRSSKQKVENSHFEEHLTPVDTMTDNLTMAEMLRAPTEGKPFTRPPNMYKEYLAEFWYSAKALKNSKVSFSIPTGGIYKEVVVNTFRNAIGKHYLPRSSEYVAPPSIDVVRHWFPTIGYGEEVFAKGTLKKSLLPPRLSSNAKRVSQGKKSGAQLRHKKHSTFLKQPSVSNKEATKDSTAEADLGLSAPNDSIPQQQDDHVIVVDDSNGDEEDEVHTTTNAKTEERNPHLLEIELPGDLKEIPSKLEDFTKTVTSLTSQIAELKTLQWELPAEFILLLVQVALVQAKLKTLDALPSLLLNVTKALNKFAQVLDSASSKTRYQSVPSACQANTMLAEGEKNTNQATISQFFQRRAEKNAKENLNNQQPKPIPPIITTQMQSPSLQSLPKCSSLPEGEHIKKQKGKRQCLQRRLRKKY
nr:hypothetical protein [Tanacetum cinerariifolium]